MGSEAALACARAGLSTLLVTTSLDTVYNLVGAGAALTPPDGTLLAELYGTDPVEVTTFELHRRAKTVLERDPNLHLLQSSVSGLETVLEIGVGRVVGVTTWEGVTRRAPLVALCVGSFLRARLSVGTLTETAGRLSEMAYDDLYDDLTARGFTFGDLTLTAPESRGAPPYTVRCRRFEGAEWDAGTLRLRRLEGLYAAGVCVSGDVSYEQAAQEGQRLARQLVAAHGTDR